MLFLLRQDFALPASRLMCLWHERQMPYRHVGICYVCHASEGLMLAHREEPEQLQPWSPKICSAAQVARELVRRRSEDMDFLCAFEVVPPSGPVHCRLFSDGERSSRPTIAELVTLLVSASLATATPTTSAVLADSGSMCGWRIIFSARRHRWL